MNRAGIEGMKVAAIMGGASLGGNALLNRVVSRSASGGNIQQENVQTDNRLVLPGNEQNNTASTREMVEDAEFPDKAILSTKPDANGRTALLFEKDLGNIFVTVQAVSDGTHSIQADTVYIRKKNSQGTVSDNGTEVPSPNRDVRNVPPQSSSMNIIYSPADMMSMFRIQRIPRGRWVAGLRCLPLTVMARRGTMWIL